jgi:hypothetical protein
MGRSPEFFSVPTKSYLDHLRGPRREGCRRPPRSRPRMTPIPTESLARPDQRMWPSIGGVPRSIPTSTPPPITDESCIGFCLSQIRKTVWAVEVTPGRKDRAVWTPEGRAGAIEDVTAVGSSLTHFNSSQQVAKKPSLTRPAISEVSCDFAQLFQVCQKPIVIWPSVPK